MEVLVTGGMGVNGARVVRKLVALGFDPVVLDRRPDYSLLPELEGQIRFLSGDIMEIDALAAIFREHRIQRVVHMAAYISPDMNREMLPVFTINAQGSVHVMEACVRAGVERLVYTSSRAAYGNLPPVGTPGYKPIAEDHPARPHHVYDVAKVASEGMGQAYQRTHGLQFAALRFAGIYGPGKMARHGNLSLRSRMVEHPLEGKAVNVPSGGDQVDDMIYVDDVAQGIVGALLADRLNHSIYNIASGRGQTIRDLADAVRAVIPGADIEVGPGLDPLGSDVSYYAIYDISRARADLGYEPRFSLEDGVRDYVDTLMRLRNGP
jgi:UDP-glucose 4-epimerase